MGVMAFGLTERMNEQVPYDQENMEREGSSKSPGPSELDLAPLYFGSNRLSEGAHQKPYN